MRCMGLTIYETALPLRQPFQISGGVVANPSLGAPHIYVRIESDEGVVGWGEARPSHRWSYETAESVFTTLRDYLAPVIVGAEIDDAELVRKSMERVIAKGITTGQPIAKAAVDTAIHDLLARSVGRPMSFLWGRRPPSNISLSYLITTEDPAELERKVASARAEGFHGVDVKLGFGLSTDLALIEALEPHVAGLFVRVDANQGYSLSEARTIGRRLARLGANVFEQPLQADDLHGHAQLRRLVDVPIALDESIWTAAGVAEASRREACDAVVVKLTKMGGPSGAKLAGDVARACGLDVLGGGLTESTIGLAASAMVFDAIGIQRPVDLNGPFFLADDPVTPKGRIADGVYHLPAGEGLGCVIDEERIAPWTRQTYRLSGN